MMYAILRADKVSGRGCETALCKPDLTEKGKQDGCFLHPSCKRKYYELVKTVHRLVRNPHGRKNAIIGRNFFRSYLTVTLNQGVQGSSP